MSAIDRRQALGKVLQAAGGCMLLAGCVGVAAPVQPHYYTLPSDVLFDFRRADLRPGAERALNDILYQIRASYSYPFIRVVGHTDSIGSDAANDALSLRRAGSVRDWLIQAGMPPAAIQVAGAGSHQPVAPNATPDGRDFPAGRAQNRRVELIASPA